MLIGCGVVFCWMLWLFVVCCFVDLLFCCLLFIYIWFVVKNIIVLQSWWSSFTITVSQSIFFLIWEFIFCNTIKTENNKYTTSIQQDISIIITITTTPIINQLRSQHTGHLIQICFYQLKMPLCLEFSIGENARICALHVFLQSRFLGYLNV